MIKKISLIVALSLVGILTITTLILGFTTKNYKPELQFEPVRIEIENKPGEAGKFVTSIAFENVEILNNVVLNFNEMFSQSILNAMFANNLFSEVEIKYVSSLPTQSGYRVEFDYQREVLLMKNGVAFKPSTDSQAEDIYFEKLIFDVSDVLGFQEFKMYAEVTEGSTYYEISTIANIQSLYENVSGLSYN